MKILKALFVLNYANYVLSNSTTDLDQDLKEMEYSEGTTVEAKYSLPPVNVSVRGNKSTHTVTASLARMLDFYNTELLAANWERFKNSLTMGCKKDVEAYIRGLDRTENWALKMDDASGRYSTGWFWGNIYWTGSQSLCEHITPQKHIVVNSQNYSRQTRAVEVSSRNIDPGASMGYKSEPLLYTSTPPFPIAFFMLRLRLNSSFTTEERIVNVGLCLPFTCSDEDVKKIMQETAISSTKVTIRVEAVRSEHNKFNIWGDKTFLILCVTTSMIAGLLIIGTSFDVYIEHLKSKNLKVKNAHFNTQLDMSMPDIKTKNGNCGLYVVNNNNNECYNNDGHLQSLEVRPGNNQSSRSHTSVLRLVLRELLLSFSLKTNINSICDQTVGSDTLSVIHGLKSISMAWVILGHTCIIAFKYSDNMEYRQVVQKEFLFQTISNGTFSVDSFFFTSGLLVSFLYFRSNAKGKLDPLTKGKSGLVAGFLHFIGLVCYRFARLTAPYLFTLGVVEVTMKWFKYNSVFEPPSMDHVNCPDYWWRNILYINTLFPVDQMCMIWSWYLSDDTQFYVLGAIMLILAASHFKSAAALVVVFIASSWMTTGYIAYSNHHMPGSDDPLALFDKIYDKPWTRLGPYLIGMCTGWLLFKKDCNIRMSKLTVTLGWTLSIACLLSLVYGLYEARLTPWVGAAYSALSHSAWALGLSWIVVACCTGYGGIVNTILSATILYPFSRVTYCAYLLHPIVIRGMVMSMDSPLHLGSVVTIIIFMGQVVASYALSFVVSLAFEAPVVSMLRIMSKVVALKKSQAAVSQS